MEKKFVQKTLFDKDVREANGVNDGFLCDTRVASDSMTYLDPSIIRFNCYNPFSYDPGTPENKALEDSIRIHGILEPLIARGGDGFVLLSGERRLHAALNIGLAKVPVQVVECDDVTAARIMLDSNLRRVSTNDSERIRVCWLEIIARAGNEKNMVQDLADRYGKTVRTVQRYVELARGLSSVMIDQIGKTISLAAAKRVLTYVETGDMDEANFIHAVEGRTKLLTPQDVDILIQNSYNILVLDEHAEEKEHIVRFTTQEMIDLCGRVVSSRELKEHIILTMREY